MPVTGIGLEMNHHFASAYRAGPDFGIGSSVEVQPVGWVFLFGRPTRPFLGSHWGSGLTFHFLAFYT